MKVGGVAPFVIAFLALPVIFLAGRLSVPKQQVAAPVARQAAAIGTSPWPEPYGFHPVDPRDPPGTSLPPLPFDRIELQRTQCFGSCPAYTVTLWRDGRAEYSGHDYAPRTGDFKGEVSPLSYGWLCFLLDSLHFDQLNSDYSSNWTDLPTTFVRAWRKPDGAPIAIRDYGYAGPVALWGIERDIDSVADGITWTPAH